LEEEGVAMNTTQAVEDISHRTGRDALLGANILLAIDRPVDNMIRQALSLGPYHFGHPSPWSHCVILAGAFAGPDTPILDCTIRDPKDPSKLLFTETAMELITMLVKPAGRIYLGRLGDYNDARVHPVGVKYIPSLTQEQRQAIVAAGTSLSSGGYSYDIPGLIRELVRLLTGIAIPPGEKKLFCSAFNQKCYRMALGATGDFNTKVSDGDTTPDDLWYSPLGAGLSPHAIVD
jgi:hypothetical protein